MRDYVKSRPAKVGEKLRTQHFHPGRVGFASPEDASTAVRVLSGTELAFATAIRCSPRSLFGWKVILVNHTTTTFRQVNKDNQGTHHDALEFPDGRMVLLTHLKQRCYSFRRNPGQPLNQKPKNEFETSVDWEPLFRSPFGARVTGDAV